MDLTEANRILGIIADIRDALTELTNAQSDLVNAGGSSVVDCLNPFGFSDCVGDGIDTASATARVTTATGKLSTKLVSASIEKGFESLIDLLPTPNNLAAKLNELEKTWTTGRILTQTTIANIEAGIPDIDLQAHATWEDEKCHRSHFAGQAQAALALENADPHTSVTFVQLSCSGATIGTAEGQIDTAATVVGDREVDAVLMSLGGNDANFSQIIAACIAQEPCNNPPFVQQTQDALNVVLECSTTIPFVDICAGQFDSWIAIAGGATSGRDVFLEGVGTLPAKYDELGRKLHDTFPAIASDPKRVYITEYPNATQDETGNECGPRPDRADPLVNLPGLSPAEWTWAAETVTRDGLNVELAKAAALGEWTLVGGIFDGFATHGYCSDNSWFVRLQDSLALQRDPKGTLHPNQQGQAVIGEHIHAALSSDMLGVSSSGITRLPQPLPVADAGGPWVVNEGSSTPVTNRSFDASRTSLAFQWSLELDPSSNATLMGSTLGRPIVVAADDATGTLKVTVTNAYGTSQATADVHVINVAPVVKAGPDLEALRGSLVNLHATFTDPGMMDTHTATVDWGDGTAPLPTWLVGREVAATHRYMEVGTYAARVTVIDDDGGIGSDTANVSVINTPPIIGLVAGHDASSRHPTIVSLSAAFFDRGVLDTHTATWDWGDGSTSSGVVLEKHGSGSVFGTHAFALRCAYRVELVVTDELGASSQAQRLVIVTHSGQDFVSDSDILTFAPPTIDDEMDSPATSSWFTF